MTEYCYFNGQWVFTTDLSSCPSNKEIWSRPNVGYGSWTKYEDKTKIAAQKETTKGQDSMTTVIIVTETPSMLDAQKGANEKIIAGPETVVAKDPNTALLVFGANHAEAIKNASPDRMMVQFRQGV